MSLVRLTSEQVAEHWAQVKYAACLVERVTPDKRGEYCRKLLEDILVAKTQIWFGLSDEEDLKERKVKISVATQLRDDPETGLRECLVLWVFGYVPMTDEDILRFYGDMQKFAKNSGSSSLKAYSNIPRVWEICEKAGAKQPYRVYKIDL